MTEEDRKEVIDMIDDMDTIEDDLMVMAARILSNLQHRVQAEVEQETTNTWMKRIKKGGANYMNRLIERVNEQQKPKQQQQ